MTKYSLRTRVIALTLAPTLIIGLLISVYFTLNRYNDLEAQLITSGTDIIEPLAIASEYGMTTHSREAIRRLISYAHRKHSDIIRSVAVFDADHKLFVTSNFHPNFKSLTFDTNTPIPLLTQISSSSTNDNIIILRSAILSEGQFINTEDRPREIIDPNKILGYIAIELDLSSLHLKQYQEVIGAFIVLLLGLGLSGFFAFRLMRDVTHPISNMVNVVDKIRRGHLNIRIEGQLHGELDTLKTGINDMAVSLLEYHIEMQNSIDQATHDLRETFEQLEIQNVELDLSKKRAQEAARIKSEFLANMSHELRTPLNGVIGFTKLILKTELSINQIDYLNTIERSAQNLLNIINDILDFSKLEAGKMLIEHIPFDLQELMDETVFMQAPGAHEKGVDITLHVDSSIPSGLLGDPLRVQQVLVNLIANAIKFTEAGCIDISAELRSCKEQELNIIFKVKDTGIGISDRQKEQIFQAFSQADASVSRQFGGTGLGLVITQNLVKKMGGDINFSSHLHQGSEFWFSLNFKPTQVPFAKKLDTRFLNGKSLLLIEPNPFVADATIKQLVDVGIDVTYRSELSEDSNFIDINQQPRINRQGGHFDFVLLSLKPDLSLDSTNIKQLVEQGMDRASQFILALPSTELALTEELMVQYPVKCIAKPIIYKKLLTLLLSKQNNPKLVGQTILALPHQLNLVTNNDEITPNTEGALFESNYTIPEPLKQRDSLKDRDTLKTRENLKAREDLEAKSNRNTAIKTKVYRETQQEDLNQHSSTINKLPINVMAVDDNTANLKLIAVLLNEQVTHVATCSSGQEAIEQASIQQFDLILMDIQMPHMDGITTANHIKKTQLNAHTPIIALTAHAIEGERERLLGLGMDEYLSKPIQEKVLSKTLRNWTGFQHCDFSDDNSSNNDVSIVSDLSVKPPVNTLSATINDSIKSDKSIIDWDVTLKKTNNNEELAVELLQMLISDIPDLYRQINRAIDDNQNGSVVDTELLLHHIHKLHGSCAYLGLTQLQRICAELETQLREGQHISAIEPELFELQDELEKLSSYATERYPPSKDDT